MAEPSRASTAPARTRRRRAALTRGLLAVVVVSLAAVLVAGTAPADAARASHPALGRSGASTRLTHHQLHRYALRMLALMNAQRRAHGLAPLRMAGKLVVSAHRHDRAMARTNTTRHQVSGEAVFATRITRTGYRWAAAGENIGWNRSTDVRGLLYLERVMYHESPPNDGHRVNILSRAFTQVGIDVYADRVHHKIWFTQDFGRPS